MSFTNFLVHTVSRVSPQLWAIVSHSFVQTSITFNKSRISAISGNKRELEGGIWAWQCSPGVFLPRQFRQKTCWTSLGGIFNRKIIYVLVEGCTARGTTALVYLQLHSSLYTGTVHVLSSVVRVHPTGLTADQGCRQVSTSFYTVQCNCTSYLLYLFICKIITKAICQFPFKWPFLFIHSRTFQLVQLCSLNLNLDNSVQFRSDSHPPPPPTGRKPVYNQSSLIVHPKVIYKSPQ